MDVPIKKIDQTSSNNLC